MTIKIQTTTSFLHPNLFCGDDGGDFSRHHRLRMAAVAVDVAVVDAADAIPRRPKSKAAVAKTRSFQRRRKTTSILAAVDVDVAVEDDVDENDAVVVVVDDDSSTTTRMQTSEIRVRVAVSWSDFAERRHFRCQRSRN